MRSDISEFVIGTSEAAHARRHQQLNLRAGLGIGGPGLGYGVSSYNQPGLGQVTSVQQPSNDHDTDDMPAMGPQFPGGGGPVVASGGSGGSMSAPTGGATA